MDVDIAQPLALHLGVVPSNHLTGKARAGTSRPWDGGPDIGAAPSRGAPAVTPTAGAKFDPVAREGNESPEDPAANAGH